MNELFTGRASIVEIPSIKFDPIIDINRPQLITEENVIEDLTISQDQTHDVLNSKVFSLSMKSTFCGSAMVYGGSGMDMFISDPERGVAF